MNMHIIIEMLEHKAKSRERDNAHQRKMIERFKDNKAEVKILKNRIKDNDRDIKHITTAIENLQKVT